MKKFIATTAALALAGASAPAMAAVIFNSLSITAATEATVGGAGGGTDADSTTTTYAVLPTNAFNVQSSAKNTANGQANAQTSVAVAFATPGDFLFDATSTTSIANLTNGISASAKAGKYVFDYLFTLTSSGNLTANWDLSAPNAIQPAFGPLFGGGLQLPATGVGSVSQALGAGTYRLKITADFQDMIAKTGAGIARGNSSDHFAFSITSVPEPAAWGLMLLGFGLVGASMRSRKGKTTVVYA
ncbi:PEP-CTERM sorting domain-containing protein [Chakrabartia godavariana]|nr:PEP-CTERM sorting domain-containing protein [Chakrabartia godavariana]